MNILCTVIMHIIKNRVIFKYHQEREKVKRKDNYELDAMIVPTLHLGRL